MLLIGLSGGLAGCALIHGSAFSTQNLPPAQRALSLTGGRDARLQQSIAYRDPWSYEEYDFADGRDGRAEALLSVANGPQTALEFPAFRLHWLTQTWVFNTHAQLDWHRTHYIGHIGHGFTYARYRRSAQASRQCIAFVSTWDTVPDDPRQRPAKALFGYYCVKPRQPLTEARIKTVLSGIRTDTRHLPRVLFGQKLPNDPQARATARGEGETTAADAGNKKFPFQFSTRYIIDNSDNNFL